MNATEVRTGFAWISLAAASSFMIGAHARAQPSPAPVTQADAGTLDAGPADTAPPDASSSELPAAAPLDGFDTVEPKAPVSADPPARADSVPALDPEAIEIIVIGSRSQRTNVETPVPVDVLTAQDISRSGQLETARVLASLAPSFNSTPQTIADGSDHVAPASLRGLGPDQVLVLINGKRQHKSALVHVNGTVGRGTVGTDLNAIPTSAIRRIEILRDGAATQYGSDAIAGVINIVLKDNVDSLDITSTAGLTGEGDGAQLKSAANLGFRLAERGFLNVSAEFLAREATQRSGTYSGTVFSEDRAEDNRLLRARRLSRDDFEMKIGESAATVGMLTYNLELPLSDQATFYSFGGLTHRAGQAAGFYRFPKQTSQVVSELYPNGFLPEIDTRIDDLSASAGVRSRLSGWGIDLSLSHGRNAFRYYVEHSNNASLGGASPTSFDAGGFSSIETVADLDLLRELPTDLFESLSFVAGSEFRLEQYQITAGDEAAYSLGPETFGDPPMPKAPGAQVFPGFAPSNQVDRTRTNIGVYTGLESQLSRGFTLDLGGRFESYSDFGEALIGKAAARVEIVPGVALRGAASSGFRAPALPQLWFNNVSTLFVPNPATNMLEATQVLTSNNRSPVTRAFGIPDLKQETSFNVSAGIALQPIENLSLTLDGYYIRIADRVVLTSRFVDTDPAVAEILAPFPDVSQAQFFANAVDTETKGVDLIGDYTLRLDPSRLMFTVSLNLSRTDVTDVHLPNALADRFAGGRAMLRTVFFGRLEENRLEDALPQLRGTAAVRYQLGPFSALIRANYYGKVYFKPDNPEFDEEFGAKILFDTELSYQIGAPLWIAIGADNVFNTFPDRQKKEANISFGRFIYSRNVSQFGQNGGFYYTKLKLGWL